MALQGWSVAGKSWTAFLGALIVALLPIIAQVAGALPAPWGAILSGVGGVISLITGRVAYRRAVSAVGDARSRADARADPAGQSELPLAQELMCGNGDRPARLGV